MPGIAGQKVHAQFLFKFFDLLGNGALGNKQGFGCLGETTQTPDFHKILQLP